LAAALAALAAAYALGACGGKTSDEDKIKEALQATYTTKDPGSCREHATRRFLEQTTLQKGAQALRSCREAARRGRPARSIVISRIDPEGDVAQAHLTVKGGDADGQRLVVALVKEHGDWKLSKIADLAIDRDKFDKALTSKLTRPPNRLSDGQAACVVGRLRTVSDSDIEQAGLDADPSVFRGPIAECTSGGSGLFAGGGSPGTGLRAGFEAALRRDLRKRQKLTKAQTECIIDRLGAILTDAQIEAVVKGRRTRGVTQAAAKAGAACVGR
jgi:hypothetical protein